MRRHRRISAAATLPLLILLAGLPEQADAADCLALASLALPQAQVEAAQEVAATHLSPGSLRRGRHRRESPFL